VDVHRRCHRSHAHHCPRPARARQPLHLDASHPINSSIPQPRVERQATENEERMAARAPPQLWWRDTEIQGSSAMHDMEMMEIGVLWSRRGDGGIL
jgi:hypothetical protein